MLNSKGDEIKRKTIFVNEPFPYKGITIYQTDWDIFGLKIFDTKNNVIKQVPLKKVVKENQKFWIGSIGLDNLKDSRLTFLINNLNKEIFLYNEKGTFIQKVLVGDEFTIKNNSLLIKELITSTGLQIKEDPGIGVIYFSFLILMGSIYISFLSYSQIWAVQEDDNIFIAGKANRAILAFQEDFKKRVNKLNSIKSKL